jgi:cytochrome c5
MKFITIPVVLSFSLLAACSLFQPAHRGVSNKAPIPDEAMAQRSKVSLTKLQTGHGVYMRKCGECHTHLLPDEVSTKDWHVVVPGMAWNAGIEPVEEKALLEYLVAAKTPQADQTKRNR